MSPFNRHFSNTDELILACQIHSPVDTVEPISDDFTESSDQFMISVMKIKIINFVLKVYVDDKLSLNCSKYQNC